MAKAWFDLTCYPWRRGRERDEMRKKVRGRGEKGLAKAEGGEEWRIRQQGMRRHVKVDIFTVTVHFVFIRFIWFSVF